MHAKFALPYTPYTSGRSAEISKTRLRSVRCSLRGSCTIPSNVVVYSAGSIPAPTNEHIKSSGPVLKSKQYANVVPLISHERVDSNFSVFCTDCPSSLSSRKEVILEDNPIRYQVFGDKFELSFFLKITASAPSACPEKSLVTSVACWVQLIAVPVPPQFAIERLERFPD